MTESANFVSCWFEFTGLSVELGLLRWVSRAEKTDRIDHYGSRNGHSYQSVVFELTDLRQTVCSVSELCGEIQSYAQEHLTRSSYHSIEALILEECPEIQTIKKQLQGFKVVTVTREGTTLEQIMRFSPQIGERLELRDYRVEPDLVCPEIGENLIDPIRSDMMSCYPLTQALLVAAHHFETTYQPYNGFSMTPCVWSY